MSTSLVASRSRDLRPPPRRELNLGMAMVGFPSMHSISALGQKIADAHEL